MRVRLIFVVFFIHQVSQPALALTCGGDFEKQKLRSEELQEIETADQEDRKPPIDWNVVSKNDETRRKRVAEIFAEGCITVPPDYLAAALVFQHGDNPDHFFQTFLWGLRAVFV